MDAADPNIMLTELIRGDPTASPGAAAVRPEKINYTHADMVDFIIANPGVSQNAIARRYGYTPGWVSQMLSSDALQELIAKRRQEIVDPVIAASLEERFRGLTMRSIEVLMAKLEAPAVEASVAVRCAELGAKSLGLGGHAPPKAPEPSEGTLDRLAARLIALNQPRPIEGAFTVEENEHAGT